MEFYLDFDQLLGRTSNPATSILLPVFLLATVVEGLLILRRQGSYPWKNAGVSLSMAIGHFITQAAVYGLIFGVIAGFVYRFRLTTIPVSFHHWPSLIVLFVLVDLAFYIEHRCSHRVLFLWASHSVHHSSEKMLVTTAYRLAWTPILSGIFLFYLPLVWVGYDPFWVYGMVSASLSYQFFVHTELVPRIGWLEWFINTPSAHRVHHASNAEYIDKNYGGVLLIWDRLFGSYQAEQSDIQIRYGLAHPRSAPNNPFVIAYEELWQTLKAAFLARNLRERVKLLCGPP
ncbi:MAG TPA: sterol desaturase family protein [Stellaceae bacterium]|nr:sterol desaturase family protein [Stellaceae bacterium]